MGNHYGAAFPSPQPDTRGHIFERSVEGGMRVLRCDCGHIWWPDQKRPSKPCPMSEDDPIAHDGDR